MLHINSAVEARHVQAYRGHDEAFLTCTNQGFHVRMDKHLTYEVWMRGGVINKRYFTNKDLACTDGV